MLWILRSNLSCLLESVDYFGHDLCRTWCWAFIKYGEMEITSGQLIVHKDQSHYNFTLNLVSHRIWSLIHEISRSWIWNGKFDLVRTTLYKGVWPRGTMAVSPRCTLWIFRIHIFRPFPSFALPYFVVNLSFALITCVCVSPHFSLLHSFTPLFLSFSARLRSTQFPYSASIFRFNKERGRGDWDQITLCNIRSKWIEDFPFSFINPLLFSFSASFGPHGWSFSLIPSIFFNFFGVLNDMSPSFSYDLVAKKYASPQAKTPRWILICSLNFAPKIDFPARK